MSDETERLRARIVAQEREIANLRGGYVLVRGQLRAALESLQLRQSHAAAAIKRAAIAAEKAAAVVETAASVASELVSEAARETKALSQAAAAAVAVKQVATEAKAKVAEVVKAEKEAAEAAESGFAALEEQHQVTGTMLRTAIELAAAIAVDSIKLRDALEEYVNPSNK